ncbi:hypothetical protein NKG94_34080 [Micromonospora sp. M12]
MSKVGWCPRPSSRVHTAGSAWLVRNVGIHRRLCAHQFGHRSTAAHRGGGERRDLADPTYGADLDRLGETESIFALGNGWVGWRGVLDEGAPCGMPGSYVNGFHERRELSYPEEGTASRRPATPSSALRTPR